MWRNGKGQFMNRRVSAIVFAVGACLFIGSLMTACGNNGNSNTTPTAVAAVTPTTTVSTAASTNPTGGASVATTMTATNATNNSANYPKLGHAPDYSWIAGWVSFTKIQGGCVYISTDAPPAPPGPTPTPGISGPIVSTAVRSDTSPPLRDMTPEPPSVPTPDVSTGLFIPGGAGWVESLWKDGDYIVAFGRVAGAGDAREMCPGGAQYVIDKVEANP